MPTIVVAGDTLTTAGPFGRAINVPGAAAPVAMETIWATNDRQAVELEIMIQVLELNGLSPRVFPDLRWQIWALGHGQFTYDFPPPQNLNLLATTRGRMPRWPVPARGVAVRVAAREIKVALACSQAGANPLVAISFQPLLGSSAGWRPFPATDIGPNQVVALGERAFFPPHATEWRITPVRNGFANTGSSAWQIDPMQPIGLLQWGMQQGSGTTEATIPAIEVLDWAPIPLGAQSWYVPTPQRSPDPVGISALYR
jgi:hypothetical protein